MTVSSTLTLHGPATEISEMLQRLANPNAVPSVQIDEGVPIEFGADTSDWSPDNPEPAETDYAENKIPEFEKPSPLPDVHGAAKIVKENDDTYLSEDGFMSFHKLRDFAACPYEFRFFPKPSTRTPITDTGSMIHKYVLEGDEAFRQTYQLWNPPINPKTDKPYGKDTKAYQEAWQGMGLSENAKLYEGGDMLIINEITASIRRHPLVSQYFESGQRLTEFTVRVDDPNSMKIKSKIDMYHEFFGLVDFKTTDDIDRFRWNARDYGYVEQLSFYHWMLTDFLGAAYCPATLIVAEYSAPYRVGLFKINAKTLQWGRDTVQKWLCEYQTCLETDVWPTRYEDEKELKI